MIGNKIMTLLTIGTTPYLRLPCIRDKHIKEKPKLNAVFGYFFISYQIYFIAF